MAIKTTIKKLRQIIREELNKASSNIINEGNLYTRSYEEFIEKKQREYPDTFDSSNLSEKFIPYFESGQRIAVKFGDIIKTGTVGVTTGWQPVFLLILTKRSMGSSYTLSDRNEIVKVLN